MHSHAEPTPAASSLEQLPLPAFIARDGVLEVAGPGARELADALLDPAVAWRGTDEVVDTPPPWRTGMRWRGTVEGVVGAESAIVHVATAPRGDGSSLTLCHRASRADVMRHVVERAVDVMPEMFSLTTAELSRPGPAFVFVNRAFEQVSGYERAAVLGQTPRILQGPRTDLAELERLRRCLAADQPFRGGAINYRRDGREFFNQWTIVAVRNRAGQVTHYASVMRDATDERFHADQIQVAAAEWAKVVDVLGELIVLVDLEFRIVRCNEAFRRLDGRSFRELNAMPLADVLFSGMPAVEVARLLRGASALGRIARRDGRYRFTAHPVRRGATLDGWVYVIEDVTERERSERQVRRLVTAAEQAHDGLALLDVDGKLEYLNASYAGLRGVERHAVTGVDADLVLSGHNPRRVLVEALAEARSVGFAVVRGAAQRCDGHTYCEELTLRRLDDADGSFTGFAVSATDVTERERLARLSESTSAMDNMAQWLSGLRHELGNPVNSVKMALTVLASNLAQLPRDEIARYVDRALSELGRIEYLLRTLRAVSSVDHLEPAAVEVMPFLARVREFVAPDLRARGIELAVAGDPALLVWADPHALVQVLVNLVSNASDAIEASGRIEITAARHDGAVELTVRDDGPGMTAERLARLFTPFETTKPGGTGLGLIIVRKLMTAMRGAIAIDSVIGRGTVATLRLESR